MVAKWIRELKISWTHNRRISSNSYLWSFSKIWTISSLFGCRCWKETRWPKKQQYFSSSNVINTRDFGYFTFMHLHSLTHTHTHTHTHYFFWSNRTHTHTHSQARTNALTRTLSVSQMLLILQFICSFRLSLMVVEMQLSSRLDQFNWTSIGKIVLDNFWQLCEPNQLKSQWNSKPSSHSILISACYSQPMLVLTPKNFRSTGSQCLPSTFHPRVESG